MADIKIMICCLHGEMVREISVQLRRRALNLPSLSQVLIQVYYYLNEYCAMKWVPDGPALTIYKNVNLQLRNRDSFRQPLFSSRLDIELLRSINTDAYLS